MNVMVYAAAAAKSLQSCPTLRNSWTAAHQAPPSMGFFRQEYWSGLPLPSPINILYYQFFVIVTLLVSQRSDLSLAICFSL